MIVRRDLLHHWLETESCSHEAYVVGRVLPSLRLVLLFPLSSTGRSRPLLELSNGRELQPKRIVHICKNELVLIATWMSWLSMAVSSHHPGGYGFRFPSLSL
eukprot:COSAG02_NODE_30833_length_544_cov_1.155056_1_plen_101_part_01